jgi:uncharacterized protein YbjQ (UPF0145 family)
VPGGRQPRSATASLLSVGQFALAARAGLEPLGPVQGADVRWLSLPLDTPDWVLRRSKQRWAPGGSAADDQPELQALTDVDAEIRVARRRVLDEIREQGIALGADLVLGIRAIRDSPVVERIDADLREAAELARKRTRQSRPLEIRGLVTQYAGTAARHASATTRAQVRRSATELPLCTVAADEYWKLICGGWQPLGLVNGCSNWLGGYQQPGWGVRELVNVSRAWEAARRDAFAEMNEQAAALGAAGVIGLDFQSVEHSHAWVIGAGYEGYGMVVGVDVTGTAIKRADRELAPPPPPAPMLSLQ